MSLDKLSVIYEPWHTINNDRTLSFFCLYFDEVHLLRNYQIKSTLIMGGSELITIYIKEESEFRKKNDPLMDDVIFFETEKDGEAISELIDQAWDISRKNDNFPGQVLTREQLIAFHAGRNGYDIVTDKDNCNQPIEKGSLTSSDLLSTIMAKSCFDVFVPSCREAHPEELLEIRLKLKDHLLPFRCSMRQVAAKLRENLSAALQDGSLSEPMTYKDLMQEAKFLTTTNIEPAIYELNHKITLEKGRLWRKIFGDTLNWIPIILRSIFMPSIETFEKAVGLSSNNLKELLDNTNTLNGLRRSGVNYLIELKKYSDKNFAHHEYTPKKYRL